MAGFLLHLRARRDALAERWRRRRVTTPTVLQMEAVECGAASLAIVLGYHGLMLPLEKLRLACDVSRDGTKASNIVKAARAYGLKAKGFRKTAESIQSMTFPLIVHWNFNHFLVLEGISKGTCYLSDPARGRYKVPLQEFEESFTGVTLAFEKGPDFVKGREKPGLMQSLMPRLVNSGQALLFVLLASLALVLPGLVVPAFTRVFIDGFLIGGSSDWVPPLLLVMAAMMGLVGALTWVQQRYLLRLETKMAVTMSSRFLWHILHLPIEFFTQRSGGEIGSRVQVNDRVAQLLSGELATALLSVLTATFYLGLMALYDGVLALITLAMALTNAIGLQLVARRRKDSNRRLLQETGKLTGTTMSGLHMMESLKASGSESEYYEKWVGYFAKMVNAEQELGVATRTVGALPGLLTALTTAAVLVVGSLRILDGELTIGTLVAFQFLMVAFLVPVGHLVRMSTMLQQAEGDLGRLDDVLRYSSSTEPSSDGAAASAPSSAPALAIGSSAKLSGRLELKGITFGYSRLSPPLLDGFDLTLEPGSRVALVGGSGSGKSTVARLVCGLYTPWSGDILFDGMTRESVPARASHQFAGVCRSERDDVRRHDPRQPDALERVDPRRPPDPRGQRRPHPRRRVGAAGRLRQRAFGGRAQLQRRPAAAAGDRPGAGAESVAARARRGDERPRRNDGEGGYGPLEEARLHLPARGPPPLDRPRLRRDHRAPPGQSRRAGHARRASRPSRTLRYSHRRPLTPHEPTQPRSSSAHPPPGRPRSTPAGCSRSVVARRLRTRRGVLPHALGRSCNRWAALSVQRGTGDPDPAGRRSGASLRVAGVGAGLEGPLGAR